ncbi:MAG: hypothetical protein M3417_13760 [Actinomycetota bacterium]|nr:hypothetical protein [Actinomycetota bacterium]
MGLTFKEAVGSLNELRQGGLDFKLPETGQLEGLIRDRGGESPCSYLRKRGFDKALIGSQTCSQLVWGPGMENCQQPGPQYPRFVKTLDLPTGNITCTRYDTRGAGLFPRDVSQDRYW